MVSHILLVREQERSTTHSSAVEVKIVVLPHPLPLPSMPMTGSNCVAHVFRHCGQVTSVPFLCSRMDIELHCSCSRQKDTPSPSGDRAASNSSWKYPLLGFRGYPHPLDDRGLPLLTEVYLDGSINQGGGSPLETTGEGSAQTRQYSAISATELKGRTFNWEVSSSFSKR